MIKALFTAREKFDPADGESWLNYYAFAKIPALREVVSLDHLVNPHLIDDLMDEDWKFIANAGYGLWFFSDFNYLLSRTPLIQRRNILGVYRNPSEHINLAPAAGFIFHGYDLLDESTEISALVNCGGFPDVFSNDELNAFGLIGNYHRANEVHKSLIQRHPDEHHAHCQLYAVWRLKETN